MKFLPYENLTFKTSLNEQAITDRLSEFIEPEKTIRFGIFSNPSKKYEGQIYGKQFELKRIIAYRNSFLPKIYGMIISQYSGSIIQIKMRMHPFILVFMCLWFGGIGVAFFVTLSQTLFRGKFDPVIFVPLGMILFGYVLTMGGFKFESNRAKDDLEQLFEGEILKRKF